MGNTEPVIYLAPAHCADTVLNTLTEAGLPAMTAATVGETLRLCAGTRPGLIITEMTLENGSGLELLEELRSDSATTSTAVMVLLDNDDLATRLDAFDAEADDCLARPFDPAELVARSRALLRRARQLSAATPAAESLLNHKITYLQKCALDPLSTIKPTRNVHSPTGYSYDQAREHFGCAPGDEIQHLENLATRMCLERSFFDHVNLCPDCGHYTINHRHICPECKSPDIAQVEVIYHLECDYVAPSRDFFSDDGYVCPRCHKELLDVGTDYEVLTEAYFCNHCRQSFISPECGCLCIQCGSTFDQDRLLSRHIYAYTISDQGLLAAQTGHLYEATLDAVLLDYGIEIFSRSYFHRQLAQETKRAQRYSHPFGLAIIRLDQYHQFLANYGEASRQYLAEVAGIIRSSTRAADIPGKHEGDSILMIFPETDLDGAQSACEKLRQGIFELESPRADVQMTVTCAVSAYPEVADSDQELFSSVSEAFAQACRSGGNVVVTAGQPTAALTV